MCKFFFNKLSSNLFPILHLHEHVDSSKLNSSITQSSPKHANCSLNECGYNESNLLFKGISIPNIVLF